MSRAGVPDAVLAAAHWALGGWIRGLGLDQRPGLASYFTEAELATGAAALELFSELGNVPEEDFAVFASDLDALVAFSRLQADQWRRGFAARPEYAFHFERRVRARRESLQEAERRLHEEERHRERAAAPPLPARPRLGYRVRRGGGPPEGEQAREQREVREKARWVAKLRQVLLELDAPILRVLGASNRPEELLATHLGSRRASTLAARTRAWARYRGWLRRVHGVGHPTAAAHVLDYFLDRRAEPCSRGTLSAILASLRFAEQVLGLPDSERWTADASVVGLVKGIIAEAPPSVGPRSQGPAKAPTAGLLGLLETLVCSPAAAEDHRLLAWWMLISAWASLRFDDHRGLSPTRITVKEDGVDLELTRTKTTGADKAVRKRTCVIGRDAWLVEPEWCTTGWSLWQAVAPCPRDYLLTQLGPDNRAVYREMGYVEYSGRMRAVISQLPCGDGLPMGADVSVYWRPHSWRSFVPSAAVALGAPEDALRWLSAWRTQAAEAYVRTSRVKTLHTQSMVAKLLRLHAGQRDPVGEHSALEDLQRHLHGRGCDEVEIDRVLQALRMFPGATITTELWTSLDETVARGSENPTEPIPEGRPSGSRRGSSKSSSEEGADDPVESGYVVAVSRNAGRRCLHKIGLCYRRPGVHYKLFRAVGPRLPPTSDYDNYCRDCWRNKAPRTGSSTAEGLGSDTGSSRRTSSSSTSSSSAEG